MTAARSSSRVAKVDAGKGVAKKDVAGRVVEPLAPVSASSSGIAMLAQAKLSVGRVDDPAELEADQMAQKFSQWNGAGGSVEVSEGSSGGDAMRSADTGTLETGGFEVGADVQSEISSRSGRGVPLADDQRSKFEQFFGKDLSAVRVHADNDASQLSGSLGAEAFTVGNDVYFGSGRYQSGASDKLLAHELTHVVQQNSTINRGIGDMLKSLFGMGKKKAPAPVEPEYGTIANADALNQGPSNPNDYEEPTLEGEPEYGTIANADADAGNRARRPLPAIPRRQMPLPAIPGARENEYAEIDPEDTYSDQAGLATSRSDYPAQGPVYESATQENPYSDSAYHPTYGSANESATQENPYSDLTGPHEIYGSANESATQENPYSDLTGPHEIYGSANPAPIRGEQNIPFPSLKNRANPAPIRGEQNIPFPSLKNYPAPIRGEEVYEYAPTPTSNVKELTKKFNDNIKDRDDNRRPRR